MVPHRAAFGVIPPGQRRWPGGGGSAAPVDGVTPPASRRLRAVFISDIHLGTAGCQAEALLDFLKHHPSDTLYLVGDIVDGWQMRRRWFWPQAHNDVVQKLLRRARKGCRVVFVPGNHDEFARQFDGLHFGGIEVANEAVHTTADGKRLWVIHGDHFDGVIQCAKWLAYVGDRAYGITLEINRHFNRVRHRLGMPYWSLSQYLKHKVKRAVSHVNHFEEAVAAEARARGYQGVVCGHIHRPEMREIEGTLYLNDGDWVESLSALVEHMDGRLELVHWHRLGHDDLSMPEPEPVAEIADLVPA
ncbi:UDP-2,3-diacylglucosamine diphosphatase [Hydrogenophaga sp. RWCD_12]|uniref:UDP-2,3-diacylglucosamine diphosphatase n=1 Tax=Hydrogenophaga sp. RWCD_12 TaxID=3391190 RepID=UPI003984E4CE